VAALVGAVATLAPLLLHVSVNLRGALQAFGFGMNMIALAPVFYADWKEHKPAREDFSSGGFFLVYAFLVLVSFAISAVALKNYFLNLR